MTPDQIEETLINTGDEIDTDQPIGPLADAFQALTSLEDDPTPPAMIEDLATTGVSGNSVGLEWTAPGDDGDTGTASSYSLRYSTDGPITDSTSFANATPVPGVPEPDTAGTVQADTVSGLPYSTEVHFAIRAYDNVGNAGDVSNSPSATTEPGPAISVTPDSFNVALETGDSTERTMTISHVGEPGAAPLEWSASIGAAPEDMTTPSDVAATSETSGSGGGAGVATASEPYSGEPTDVGPTAMTYQIDDGTSENALGYGGLGDNFDHMWLNAFQAVEGAGTVTQISTTWGWAESSDGPPAGKEGLAIVYSDPDNDGNPDDAELLTETTITVEDPNTNNFTTVDIPPTPVEGTFFVAVLLQNNSSDTFTGPMDESSTYQDASWTIATTDAGNFNKEDLDANETFETMQQAGFPANWMLRAEGSSGFLSISPTSGTIEQGNSQDVAAMFNAEGVAPGIYEASINVMSNDPSQPVASVPSTLEVTSGPPGIAVDPTEVDFGDVFTGTAVSDTVTVTNTGGTALQVSEVSLTGSDAFVLMDSTDADGFDLPYEESREIEIQYTPTESGSDSGTLTMNAEEGVSASVSLQGEGTPFVSIEPDSLSETIDLTTGDSTATDEFTVTNEFDESLPFSVVIEQLEGETENMDFTPKLVDEQLQRWRQMQNATPPESGGGEPSLKAAPKSDQQGTSAIERLMGTEPLDAVGVTGYGNEVIAPEVLSFDIGLPSEVTVLGEGMDSFAGNFTFANNEEVYWIENESNLLKTYNIADGTIEEVGELEPEGSDVTWTDMETDPTDGTTYVTSGEGNTNRLYELDVDDAELTHIGDFADGSLVVALAIDGEGAGYAHDISDDVIRSVNLETAESEVIGSTGIIANFAQSMTWDGETGQILMAAYHGPLCTIGICESSFRQVDRETGNTTLIGPLGDGGDELGWLATPGQGIPWLSTNLEQGVLPAGASLTLEAQYDASGVVEGDYSAQISIVGDELQGEPSESLPVSLTVEAAPVLFLSKDSLNYEDTFVNDTTSTQMVTLRNDGLADMTINSVSVDDSAFLVSPNPDSAFTLEPGDAQIFEVAFAPDAVADYSATLSFEGNEVSGEVSLTGTGIAAPELAVSPESFEKQAYLGQQQEHTLEVSNTGGNPLEYNASILPSMPPAQDVLLEEETFDSMPPEGWNRTGPNDGENWRLSETDNAGGEPPEAEFYWSPSAVGTWRLITPQMDTEGLGRVVAQFDHYINNFTDPDDFQVRLESTGDGGDTWTTVAEFPAEDMPATREVITIDNEDVGSDEFHLAWTFEGDSFNINWWNVDNVSVFAEGDWLAVEPTSGTIEPSETDTLDLMVDTNVPGLEEGTYESGVNFVTNDPLAETYEVPFILHVIEELAVQPNPSTDEVHPNEGFAVDFGVESLDDLQVYSYELTMEYDPDRMQVQEVVTEGTLSEGLTLSSSIDNESGSVTIVAAEGGESSPSGQEPKKGPALFQIEGEGTLVSLDAQGEPDLGDVTLDMTNMVFNEGEPPATAKDSTISIVPLYGDVNLDVSVTAADAMMTLDYVAGKTSLIDAQKTQAEVSGDGEVSAYDASLILRRTVGDIDCFPVAPTCEDTDPALAGKSSSEASSDEGEVSFAWGEVSRMEPSAAKSSSSEATLSLPLTVEQGGAGSVRAIEVQTEIDPDKVSVQGLKSQAPEDWRAVHHVSKDGTLKISMAGATPLSKVGKVATLTLQRKEGSDAQLKMGGNVTVNEGSGQELKTKSIVSIPDEFALEGTYPNPFRQSATLKMDLPKEATVTVEVYDLLGRRVKTAHNGEMSAGTGRTVRINGTDMSSGTYFFRARVEMGDNVRTKSGKMTVVQ